MFRSSFSVKGKNTHSIDNLSFLTQNYAYTYKRRRCQSCELPQSIDSRDSANAYPVFKRNRASNASGCPGESLLQGYIPTTTAVYIHASFPRNFGIIRIPFVKSVRTKASIYIREFIVMRIKYISTHKCAISPFLIRYSQLVIIHELLAENFFHK